MGLDGRAFGIAPSKGPCISGPLNVSQNMQTAQQLANKFIYGTPGQAYDAAKAFINLVHTGGDWDPKSGPGGPTDINVAAGNINFGATCSQFGSNSTAGGVACQVGAGLYQYHTQGHFGSPFFSQYHGDTPSDNMQIRQGLAIAKKGGC